MDELTKSFLKNVGIDEERAQKWPRDLSKNPYDDEQFMIEVIKENPKNIKWANYKITKTISFMIKVVEDCPFEAVEDYYKRRSLFTEKEFIEKLAAKYPRFVEKKLLEDPKKYASLFRNENLMSILLQDDYDPRLLEHIKINSITEPSIAMKLIEKYDFASVIGKIGKELNNNVDFILTLIEKYDLEKVKPIIVYVVRYNTTFINRLVEKYSLDNIIDTLSETENEKEFLKFNFNRGINKDVDEIIKNREYYLRYIKYPESLGNNTKNEPVIMLDLAVIYPTMYHYASNRLKTDRWFMSEAIKRGVSSELVEEEYKKNKNYKANNIRKGREESRETFEMVFGTRAERLKKQYTLEEGDHPEIVLVKNFVESKMTKGQFCEANSLLEDEFEDILERVSLAFPDLAEDIKQHNKQSSAIHLEKVERIKEGILNGTINIYEFARENNGNIKIREILYKCNREEKINIEIKILEAIRSGLLNMKDYVRLFSNEYNFEAAKENIDEFIRQVGRDNPELHGEGKPIQLARRQVNGLNKYKKQYRKQDFIGVNLIIPDKKTGREISQEITEEIVDYAMKYLRLVDEYICSSTIDEAIKKIILGDVTREDIDNKILRREPVDSLLETKNKEKNETSTSKKDDEEKNEPLTKQQAIALFYKYQAMLTAIDKQLEQATKQANQEKAKELKEKRTITLNKMKEVKESIDR